MCPAASRCVQRRSAVKTNGAWGAQGRTSIPHHPPRRCRERPTHPPRGATRLRRLLAQPAGGGPLARPALVGVGGRVESKGEGGCVWSWGGAGGGSAGGAAGLPTDGSKR